MGVFIRVEIDDQKCPGAGKEAECIRICPVNIFEARGDKVVAKEENEDECILCYLCIDKCKGSAISIKRLYE